MKDYELPSVDSVLGETTLREGYGIGGNYSLGECAFFEESFSCEIAYAKRGKGGREKKKPKNGGRPPRERTPIRERGETIGTRLETRKKPDKTIKKGNRRLPIITENS
ncbi:MAG: hypothetical protein KKF68_02280 [Nanoarchaeota archaeon]|nr:hypothetical protein [Nanoarchaeota archaeon]